MKTKKEKGAIQYPFSYPKKPDFPALKSPKKDTFKIMPALLMNDHIRISQIQELA